MTTFAPIGLFIYKRPAHTRRTISSLMTCQEFERSPVFVFADGPRSVAEEQIVLQARETARGLLGDRAEFFESEDNQGLASSIIRGVTHLCERYGKVIVIEDDTVVADSFLKFLNDGLVKYASMPRVMQVSGYMHQVASLEQSQEAQLLPIASSWGWATWHRAWQRFDPEATGWESLLKDRVNRRQFDLDGHYPYSRMLRRQMEGRLDSWGIRWYYSMFKHDGLAVYPPRTLVHNIGHDGTGTHSGTTEIRQPELPVDAVFSFPSHIEESPNTAEVYRAIRRTVIDMRVRRLVSTLPSLPAEFLSRVTRRF